MELTNIALDKETEQKIREYIPYIHTSQDMSFVADWFLTMGLAMVKLSLLKHPELSVGDLMKMTFSDKSHMN